MPDPNSPTPKTHGISRGWDYLGTLSTKLGDLQGYATLAYELIQNADDAKNTSAITFSIADDALIVDNNGVFSDCGHAEEEGECPWREDPSISYRCDFHRLRFIAGNDKRYQENTTGAFGIGFIAVYQVTDRPEIISHGRHWILREELDEDNRIQVCTGCDKCQPPSPGTRFILPWARDPKSELRIQLRADNMTGEKIQQLFEELQTALPNALLFLKQLDTMRLRRNLELAFQAQRIVDGDTLYINQGANQQVWRLYHSDFSEEAKKLRLKYPNRIEDKRRSKVTIVVPNEPISGGYLYAVLPTRTESGLPFHVNADFFPYSDRKGIIFEANYQSEWNRAALRSAADAFREALPRLPQQIGHVRFWGMMKSVYDLNRKAVDNVVEHAFKSFWDEVAIDLSDTLAALTTLGQWHKPSETVYLFAPAEDAAIPALEFFGCQIIRSEVRGYINQMRQEDHGIKPLDLAYLASRLQIKNFTQRVSLRDLPEPLSTEKGLSVLWDEIALLRKRAGSSGNSFLNALQTSSLALTRDRFLYPCRRVYRADQETIALFSRLRPELPFLSIAAESSELFIQLCPAFTPEAAARELSHLTRAELERARAENRLDPRALLEWFESRRDESLHDEAVKTAIRDLPIYPGASGLRPLSQLTLSGGYVDELGVADVVAVDQLGNREDFLRDLGATELTFRKYVMDFLPLAFTADSTISIDKKRRAVRLLADKLSSFIDDESLLEHLRKLPLVECTDGLFYIPGSVYFHESEVTELLGSRYPIAVLGMRPSKALHDLYTALDVPSRPRWLHLITRIEELTSSRPTAASRQAIQEIFAYLGKRVRDDLSKAGIAKLKSTSWLPAEHDPTRWYSPSEICADYRSYLFASQAQFLDIETAVQQDCSELVKALDIRSEPTPSEVVAHLLYCAQQEKEVNREVYTFLDHNAQDPAINRLKDRACLILPNGSYVRPDQVFWGDHPFWQFRYKLGSNLRHLENLFRALNIREKPDHTDAHQVLLEIADAYGAANRPLDDQTFAVVMACWQMLDDALRFDHAETLVAGLTNYQVIPNHRRILYPPVWLLFEDKAGLGSKFDAALLDHLIPRYHNAWQAMQRAGVQSLNEIADPELLECVDSTPDDILTERLTLRRLQLVRVLEAQAFGAERALSRLNGISYSSVRELRVRWQLSVFNREFESPPESVPVHYQREDGMLYYVPREGALPWPSLARELAIILLPDLEPGAVASGIKEVLAPNSLAEVSTNLDELGFPPLEGAPETSPVSSSEITSLGGSAPPTTAPLTPADAAGIMLGDHVPPPVPPLPDDGSDRPLPGSGLGGGSGQGKGANRSGAKDSGHGRKPDMNDGSRLSTYVNHGEKSKSELNPALQQQRTETDEAAIAFVKLYEEQQGRSAEVMPHNNPGYDIKSYDAAGNLVRLIEVKGVIGLWNKTGVSVTASEFNQAQEVGELYWLYVVERAATDERRLFRINNPARLVSDYMYDKGWRDLAEPDEVHLVAPTN